MILAFDTSSETCTAALFDGEDERCIDWRDDAIGRGHAEYLVPMIESLIDGRRPDSILVGVGPGSFTGIRVGIAAAHGLAIGWDCPVYGMNSLALLAASAEPNGPIAVAVRGGHGELFVQAFNGATLDVLEALRNLPPEGAARAFPHALVAGSGAGQLVAARGYGEAREVAASARFALRLPKALRTLDPKPHYARAPDARTAA